MKGAADFAIYQRDKNGYAKIPFEGDIPENFKNCEGVWARVFLEDSNLEVVPFVRCNVHDGHWSTELLVPEGGLYRLEASVGNENDRYTNAKIKIVHHVGVGELYLVTGQSNMAGYGRDMAYDPPELGVHSFGNDGAWHIGTHPLNDACNTIYPENYEPGNCTSPSLAFARAMRRSLCVPVGLVQASLGGSPLKDWHPEEDGRLYRGMMRRIDVTGPVGGVIWYQGCSDTNAQDGPAYLSRFARMVSLWREKLGDIPFITAQLNRYIQAGAEHDKYFGVVREAQRQAARTIPGVCVITTTDLPLSDEIHNSSGANVIIGERMASAALKKIYSKPGITFPDLESARLIADNIIELVMSDPDDMPFTNAGSLVRDVNVQDENGMAACVSCGLGRTITLTFERPVTLPAELHYAWRNSVGCFPARNRQNLPMLAFYGVKIEDARK